MEGCPKTLMISFDTKEPVTADFTQPIEKYIQDHYQENPQLYKNEIQQINQLKKSISGVTRDNQGCGLLRRYYAQLCFLQSRFPMGQGAAAAVTFTWYDVYMGDPMSRKDIRFEQACVLFNLAGLYSQLGANEGRLTDESMKVACTYFQCSAGIFQYLRDNYLLDSLPDMVGDILQLKAIIMLGQAQECLLEKSIRDSRKNTLIARICMQIVEYFEEAVKLLRGDSTLEMGSSLRKSWVKHLQIKILSCYTTAYIYMSNEADTDKKFGDKVGYLKAASSKMNEAMKMSKNQPEQVVEGLKFLCDVVGTKLEAAVKENDFVYHGIVPEMDKLPEIKAVCLVKAMPFQYDDPSISGPDIFQRLIPMRAHEASSLYSEEKADLLREISKEIELKDIQLSESLSSMHIDDLMDPVDESMPESLLEKRKHLTEKGDIVNSTADNIRELAKLSEEFEMILNEIATKLKMEEKFERESKVRESESGLSMEMENLKKEFAQCSEVNEKARVTNASLCDHFEESKPIIELLAGPEEAVLASLPSQNVIDAPADEPVVQRIRELLGAIDKMKAQRKTCEKQLREQLNKDDITSILVIKEDGNKQEFFREQLKKHDELKAVIRQNLSAQDGILLSLTESNAKYAPTRIAAGEISAQRDAQIRSYLAHAKLFEEVRERLGRGLAFYKNLRDTLLKLQKKVNEFSLNQQKEKEKFLKLKKKDAPPSRPTAPKPTFDRAAKPTESHPSPNAMPTSQMFHPNLSGPMQRPQLLEDDKQAVQPFLSAGGMHPQNLPQGMQLPIGYQNPRPIRPDGSIMQPRIPSSYPLGGSQPRFTATGQILPQPTPQGQMQLRPLPSSQAPLQPGLPNSGQGQMQPRPVPQNQGPLQPGSQSSQGQMQQRHLPPSQSQMQPRPSSAGYAGDVTRQTPASNMSVNSQQHYRPPVQQMRPTGQDTNIQAPRRDSRDISSTQPISTYQLPQTPLQAQIPPNQIGQAQGFRMQEPGLRPRGMVPESNQPRMVNPNQPRFSMEQPIRHLSQETLRPQSRPQAPTFQPGVMGQTNPAQSQHQMQLRAQHDSFRAREDPRSPFISSAPPTGPSFFPSISSTDQARFSSYQNIQMDPNIRAHGQLTQFPLMQNEAQRPMQQVFPSSQGQILPRQVPPNMMRNIPPNQGIPVLRQQLSQDLRQPAEGPGRWKQGMARRDSGQGILQPRMPPSASQTTFRSPGPKQLYQRQYSNPDQHLPDQHRLPVLPEPLQPVRKLQEPLLPAKIGTDMQDLRQQPPLAHGIARRGDVQQNIAAVPNRATALPTPISYNQSQDVDTQRGGYPIHAKQDGQDRAAARIMENPQFVQPSQPTPPMGNNPQFVQPLQPTQPIGNNQKHTGMVNTNQERPQSTVRAAKTHGQVPNLIPNHDSQGVSLRDNAQSYVSAESNIAANNQYAFQGPISNPKPESSGNRSSDFSSMPDGGLEKRYETPSAPPPPAQNPGMRSHPPYSPTQIYDPVTMNNRPVMAATRSSDSLISGLLGNASSSQGQKNSAEGMQVGMQQFQIQQLFIQQQQLINMIQNQQNQQKATESLQIEKLQNQLVNQQRYIEKLANEQHKLQYQHEVSTEEQSNLLLNQFQQKIQEQNEKLRLQQEELQRLHLVAQKSPPNPVGSFGGTSSSADVENASQTLVSTGRNASPPLVTTVQNASTPSVSTIENPVLPLASTVQNSALPLASTAQNNMQCLAPAVQTSTSSVQNTAPLSASTIMNTIQPQASSAQNAKLLCSTHENEARVGLLSPKEHSFDLVSSVSSENSSRRCNSVDISLSAISPRQTHEDKSALPAENANEKSSDDAKLPRERENSAKAQLIRDLDEFEFEMGAVLAGAMTNSLKTPTCESSAQLGESHWNQDVGNSFQASMDDFPSKPGDKESMDSTESGDHKDLVDDNEERDITSSASESTFPFYEPMLDKEQTERSKQMSNTALPRVTERDPVADNDKEIAANSDSAQKISPGLTESSADQSISTSKTASVSDAGTLLDLENTDELSLKDNQPILNTSSALGAKSSPIEPIEDASGLSVGSCSTDKSGSITSLPNTAPIPEVLQLPDYPVIGIDVNQQNDERVAKSEEASPILTPPSDNTPDSTKSLLASPDGCILLSPEPDDAIQRPLLNRQDGRMSFLQAQEEEAGLKAYLEDLDVSVEILHEQCMDLCKKQEGKTIDGFTQLWDDLAQVEELDSCSYTTNAGRQNANKNRYRDILPYDHTRVLLKTLPNDYINASHVNKLTPLSPAYIATQGPIPQCFADFWMMVWEQGCTTIVMLTNEVEGTKLKCHPYWPRKLEQAVEYGDVAVYLMEQEVGPSWKSRKFLVTNLMVNDSRVVTQLQFTSWPDYGIPNTPYDLLTFIEEVRRCYESTDRVDVHPLLLHCSAGVGRTGTFSCIYSAIEEINGGNGLVEVPGLIRKLRQCRFHMVQRKEQLIFCYQAILCYAQQFLAEEQMKQDALNKSSTSPTEDEVMLRLDKVETASGTEKIEPHQENIESKIQGETSPGENFQSSQQYSDRNACSESKDDHIADLGSNEQYSRYAENPDLNVPESDAAAGTDIPVLPSVPDDSELLDIEGRGGRDRADSTPKFKVKSDIFSTRSPPPSPGIHPGHADNNFE